MNRFKSSVFVFALALLAFSANTFAQGGAMQPGTDKKKELPAGMKGANAKDPRATLKAGLFDAGEAAFGMKHVSLSKKPAAFDVGTDPSAPIVAKALSASVDGSAQRSNGIRRARICEFRYGVPGQSSVHGQFLRYADL
jgi:hypothetical protein